MASYDFESSGSGALAGALGGAGIGAAVGGPLGAAIGGGAGLLAGFFTSPKRKAPGSSINISKELDKIGDLFREQRAAVTRGIEEDLAGKKFSLASSLAGRGIYSSPVSEYGYRELDRGAQSALAQALAGLGSQEAQTRSSLLATLMGQKFESQQAEEDRRRAARNQLLSSLTGMGTSLLLASGRGRSPRAPVAGGGGMPSGYGVSTEDMKPTYGYGWSGEYSQPTTYQTGF